MKKKLFNLQTQIQDMAYHRLSSPQTHVKTDKNPRNTLSGRASVVLFELLKQATGYESHELNEHEEDGHHASALVEG